MISPALHRVSTAICDPEAFYPLRQLVQGPFEDLSELHAVEEFVRTAVLHDSMQMTGTPFAFDGVEREWEDEEIEAGGRSIIVAIAPTFNGYDFMTMEPSQTPDFPLSAKLVAVAEDFSNATFGNIYFDAHLKQLKRVFATIQSGGSALLRSDFGQKAIASAQGFPLDLFKSLDDEWKNLARELNSSNFGFNVPPVLSIVLNRANKREDIPRVIGELRNEWSVARAKVWEQIDLLHNTKTVREFRAVEAKLKAAANAFSPHNSLLGQSPMQIFWDILAGSIGGLVTAEITHRSFVTTSIAGASTQIVKTGVQVARQVSPFILERGAFDLAKRIRSELQRVEVEHVRRLLGSAEIKALNL